MNRLKNFIRLYPWTLKILGLALILSTHISHVIAAENNLELSTATSPLTELFARGNIAYNAGDYPKAIALYQECLSKGQSAALHYNLGNSYYQISDIGRAVLHYNKALVIDPRTPDVLKNLTFVNESLGLPKPYPGALDKLTSLFSINTWTWLTTLAFWSSCILILLPRLFRFNRSPIRSLLLLTFLITALSLTGLIGSYAKLKQGVILNNDVPLKISPTENSPQSAFLQAGEIATAKKELLGWSYVIGPNNKTGWVSNKNFQKIWD